MANSAGFEYAFLEKRFYTKYAGAEHAGADLCVAILVSEMGAGVLESEGLCYDKLSSIRGILKKHVPTGKKFDDPWHAHKALVAEIAQVERDSAASELTGLSGALTPAVKQQFKSKTSSTAEKAAWARAWRFPDQRELSPVPAEALSKLLESVAKEFEVTKPGFYTSMVESYFSTQNMFWQKGHSYTWPQIRIRLCAQLLHFNRVRDWQKTVYELCSGVLHLDQLARPPDE